jgi:hypothetical protein
MAEGSKPCQLAIEDAIHLLQTFRGADLTRTIGQIEKSVKRSCSNSCAAVLTMCGARADVLGAAGLIKQLAGLRMAGAFAHELLAGAKQVSHLLGRFVGHKTGPDQPMRH